MLCLSVPSSSPTLLIVMKTTSRPEEQEEPLSASSFGAKFLKEADYLFIDANCTHIHDCDTNKKSINNVLEYIKTNMGQYGLN